MPHLPKKVRENFLYRSIEKFLGHFDLHLTAQAISNILAVIVGALAGLGAVAFRYLINFNHYFFFTVCKDIFSFLGEYYVVVVPALGGLLVGPMVYNFAREAKGHGVPEVMENVALKGGRIRARVAAIKSLASSICIGSGGSVGREGPIVQIGSSLGSSVGQLLRLRPDLIKGLVACGAAGGISATFNAPLGGVIFALEVILGNFSANTFVSLTLASFSALVVALPFFGSSPAFKVTHFTFQGAEEIPLYIAMGIFGAVIAHFYVKALYFTEDFWDRIRFPEQFKPVVGGLIIGSLGFFYPHIFGVGYETIEGAMLNQLPLVLLISLVFLKIFATSITIGSGGSGGVFAPSLFIGAMLGGAFGKLVVIYFPDVATPAGAYSLVGMGTIFAAAAQAPITAVIILFELTDDYHLIMPIMLSCSISYLLYRQFSKESIYTMKLIRRGVHLHGGRDLNVLQDIMVKDIMGKKVEIVSEEMPLPGLQKLIQSTEHMGFPVVNDKGELSGMVTFDDFHYVENNADLNNMKVKDIFKHDHIIVTYPDETLDDVVHKLGLRHVGRLPVVDRNNPKRLLGLITRTDIVNAYSKYQAFGKYS